jgi:hypothetical protein
VGEIKPIADFEDMLYNKAMNAKRYPAFVKAESPNMETLLQFFEHHGVEEPKWVRLSLVSAFAKKRGRGRLYLRGLVEAGQVHKQWTSKEGKRFVVIRLSHNTSETRAKYEEWRSNIKAQQWKSQLAAASGTKTMSQRRAAGLKISKVRGKQPVKLNGRSSKLNGRSGRCRGE